MLCAPLSEVETVNEKHTPANYAFSREAAKPFAFGGFVVFLFRGFVETIYVVLNYFIHVFQIILILCSF